MELEHVVLGVLFLVLISYAVYMIFRPEKKTEIFGTVMVAKNENEKNPEGIFLEISIPPEEWKDGEIVSFRVKYVTPRK